MVLLARDGCRGGRHERPPPPPPTSVHVGRAGRSGRRTSRRAAHGEHAGAVTEDGQNLNDLVGSGYVLGASLFAVVGWLAILSWLRLRSGDERAAADRTTLCSAAVVVMGIPIEAVFSFSSMEGYCYGNGSERAAHLTVAVLGLLAGAATGLLGEHGRSV